MAVAITLLICGIAILAVLMIKEPTMSAQLDQLANAIARLAADVDAAVLNLQGQVAALTQQVADLQGQLAGIDDQTVALNIVAGKLEEILPAKQPAQ